MLTDLSPQGFVHGEIRVPVHCSAPTTPQPDPSYPGAKRKESSRRDDRILHPSQEFERETWSLGSFRLLAC